MAPGQVARFIAKGDDKKEAWKREVVEPDTRYDRNTHGVHCFERFCAVQKLICVLPSAPLMKPIWTE